MSDKRAVYAIRVGLIHATIWGYDGKHGRRYEFTVGRAYGVGDHAFRYSTTFHERDAEALGRVTQRAADIIREANQDNEKDAEESAPPALDHANHNLSRVSSTPSSVTGLGRRST